VHDLYSTHLLNIRGIRKGFHQLTVREIKPLIEGAVKIVFKVPENLNNSFSFKPGQHLNILICNEREELCRSYSICSGPGEPLSIAVKTCLNGKVSGLLNNALKEGDQLVVSEPIGSFVLNRDAKNIVLIGAGSGITPLLSMYKHAISSSVQVTLIYGNTKESSIMFLEEINAFQSGRVIQFLSGEQKEGFLSGRINIENFSALIAKETTLLNADEYYLCGPGEMIDDIRSYLESSNVRPDKIHFELFKTPVRTAKDELEFKTQNLVKCHLQIILEGEKYHLEIDSDDTFIIDAAINAEIEVPFSCKSGICGSCRAKILNGKAIMKNNYALTPNEVNEGYILTCQSVPTGENLSISYDD
jgi:ring-1,2-phenylacetyl-CoA epoxidase subunit PaaE